MAKRVLVSCGAREARPEYSRTTPRVRPSRAEVFVAQAIVERLQRAGASVLLIPPGGEGELLEVADALVLTGGAFDIPPHLYGQKVLGRLDGVDERRSMTEIALCKGALERGIPLLGICGGMQVMAVATGGTLFQDIHTQIPGALEHEQPTDPATPWHPLLTEAPWNSLLPTHVNSTHHQAIQDPGACSIIARAPDGVAEALTLAGHPFAIGVQWHPEWREQALFDALLSACADYHSS